MIILGRWVGGRFSPAYLFASARKPIASFSCPPPRFISSTGKRVCMGRGVRLRWDTEKGFQQGNSRLGRVLEYLLEEVDPKT